MVGILRFLGLQWIIKGWGFDSCHQDEDLLVQGKKDHRFSIKLIRDTMDLLFSGIQITCSLETKESPDRLRSEISICLVVLKESYLQGIFIWFLFLKKIGMIPYQYWFLLVNLQKIRKIKAVNWISFSFSSVEKILTNWIRDCIITIASLAEKNLGI